MNDNIKSLSKFYYDLSGTKFTFVTPNAYSAFQFAKSMKIQKIIFEDNFDAKYLGYGLKTKIRVYLNKSLVSDNNKIKLAEFAKKHYNPIEYSDNEGIFVTSKSKGDVYDIQYDNSDEFVFYSNIKDVNKAIHNKKIVGFSADTSIFNGSKSLEKQIRILQQNKKVKKNVFPEYETSQIQSIMNSKNTIHFAHLKFMLQNMDSIVGNPLFKGLLTNFGSILPTVKKFSFAMDSFTKKEVFNPALMNESRMSRIALGSKVPLQVVQQLCELCKKLRSEDMSSLISKIASVNPEFKKFEGLLDGLLKK